MASSLKGEDKKLQTHWYNILKEEGFVDIEDTSLDDRPLIEWHNFKFKKCNIERRMATETYIDEARNLLHTYGFANSTHRLIWELHCEGTSIREIAKKISDTPETYRKSRVFTIIKNISRAIVKGPKMSGKIVVRDFDPNIDEPAIYSSWPKALWYGSLNEIKENKHDFFKKYYSYIKNKLQRARVYVACSDSDQTTIFGFAVIDGSCLDWIAVKELFRNQGIASLLLKGKHIESVNPDCMTREGEVILRKHPELIKQPMENNENGTREYTSPREESSLENSTEASA